MKKYLLLFGMFTMLGCNHGEPVSILRAATLDSDTLIKNLSRFYFQIQSEKALIETKLGLQNLDTGTVGFELRISSGLNDGGPGYVVLMHQADLWTGKYYKVTYDISVSDDSLENFSVVEQAIAPGSGWNRLGSKLMKFNILKLKDYEDLRGYVPVTTGDRNVTVEFANQTQHTFYSMPEPGSHPEFEDAVFLNKIIELVRKEFSVMM